MLFHDQAVARALAEASTGQKQNIGSAVGAAPSVRYYDNAERQTWRKRNDIISGWDWSLPDWVHPPKNGFVLTGMGPHDKTFPGNRLCSVSSTWAQLEPEEGHYDFDGLRGQIEANLRKGCQGVELHVRATVWETRYFEPNQEDTAQPSYRAEAGSAPRWLSQHGIALREEKPHWDADKPFQIVNMDIFNLEYHRRYLRFIQKLGESGVLAMPGVRIVYVHMISASRGEEGGPDWEPGDREYPLVKKRLKAWSQAAGPNAGRLAFTKHNGPLLDYAYQLGMGQRNGWIEMYLLHVDNASLGQHMDDKGYLITDEDFPPIKENRAWADENEEYSPGWVARYGPIEGFPHRYHEASLRALQMRRNSLWEQVGNKTLDPHLTAYVGLTLGRTIDVTPDAWSELRESYVHKGEKHNGPVVPVKNFERWLVQRDQPGYETTPTRRVNYGWGDKSSVVSTMSSTYVEDRLFDYTARKGRRIGLMIDPRFLAFSGGDVAIKVTYYDNCDWKLRANGIGAPIEREVKSTRTDEPCTATFFIKGLRARTANEPFDLVIEGTGGEAEVSFVRIIRTSPVTSQKP
jgi:hypothetical protein